MQKSAHPFLADWFAISLRWLALLGITISLLVSQKQDWWITGVMLFSAVWNLSISVIAIFNRRMVWHRHLNVWVDFSITIALYYFSGGLEGPLIWGGLMTLFSSAIYFGFPGSLIMAVVVTVFQTVISMLGLTYITLGTLQKMGILTAFNLIAGLVFGFLSAKLYKAVSNNFQNILKNRQDNDRALMRGERRRMQAFYSMIETLSATLDYQVVLETSLDMCAATLGLSEEESARVISAILLFSDHDLRVGTSRGLSRADQNLTFPAENGLLKDVVDTAEPHQTHNVSEDPELKDITALQPCNSVLCLPIRRGLNAYGVMLFGHPDPRFFNAERSELIEMISHQVVVAIQNARLFQDLETEKERIIGTQEEERKQLARHLHDGPTQSVSGIAMRVEYIQKLMELKQEPEKIAEELTQLKELARRTVQEIRHMLFILRPLVLESEGLLTALQAMAEKMKDLYQQNVVVEVDEEVVEKLESSKQTVIFQIVEEAVNNARKHAKASIIRVRIHYVTKQKNIALLEIADDGQGFNVKSVTSAYERRGSLGMVNLRERADLINGILHIDSAPGKGTIVHVAIPLTPEAADRLQRGLVKP